MPIPQSEYIWHNGRLVAWAQATVHVMAHALHYGSSVFEGIRVYPTPAGPRVLRLGDHIRRMYESAKIYRMRIPFPEAELSAACCDVVLANELNDGAYIRPIAFRGVGEAGLAPKEDHPVETVIAAWQWGSYLGADAMEQGVDVCISSWQRVAPNTMPAMAKAGGNYLSSQLISMEARRLGFAEGIALTTHGTVSEGAGENVFIVRDGRIVTPPATSSILTGITRHTVITLAREAGLEIIEQEIPRELLYICDEMFLTGTAAEITPVRSVDRIEIGSGRRGPITEMLQKQFLGLFTGETEDKWQWLDRLDASRKPGQPVAV